jgi:ribosomal protein L16 Arg81 hydroxylase
MQSWRNQAQARHEQVQVLQNDNDDRLFEMGEQINDHHEQSQQLQDGRDELEEKL